MTEANKFIGAILTEIVNPTLILLFALAVFWFIWGVVQYIQGDDNGGDRTTGARHIMYGIIGLFIMVSAYAIVQIVGRTFGLL